MKLHELAPVPGSKKTRTRLGRGLGTGGGTTHHDDSSLAFHGFDLSVTFL